jgi:hypothetical protein
MGDVIIIILLVINWLSDIMVCRRLAKLEELESDMRSVKKTAYDNFERIMKMEYYSNNK